MYPQREGTPDTGPWAWMGEGSVEAEELVCGCLQGSGWGNRIVAMGADRKNILLEKKGIVVICYLFAGESVSPFRDRVTDSTEGKWSNQSQSGSLEGLIKAQKIIAPG